MNFNNYYPLANPCSYHASFYLRQNYRGTYFFHRVAFRVPVNMTKFDIREYLRKLYGVKVVKVNTYIKLPQSKMSSHRSWFKTDAQYKKAIVTCEETIPDEVKMMHSCRDLRLNPAVTKGLLDSKITRGNPARPGQSRSNDWKPRHRLAWREPIPMLLRSKPEERPKLFTAMQERELQIDQRLPFTHFTGNREMPLNVGSQKFPRPNAKLIINSRKGLVSNTGKGESVLAKRIFSNPHLVK